MDPEKILSQVAKLLGLEDSASREDMVKALDAVAALLEAQSGESDEPAPEESAEASAPEVAQVAEASTSTDDAVKATLGEAVGDTPIQAMDDPAAVAAEASAVVELIAQASGLDAASVLAGLREKAEAIAQVLADAPSGMPADDAQMSRAAGVALSAAKARTEAAEAKVAKLSADVVKLSATITELKHGESLRRIEDAIAKGHVLPKHRDLFAALAKSDPAEFDAQIKAAAGAPAVPTGTIAASRTEAPTPRTVGGQVKNLGDLERLKKNLKAAGLSPEKIAAHIERLSN